jgi:hypothetical protein
MPTPESDYRTIPLIQRRLNIENRGDHAVMFVTYRENLLECKISLEDVERVTAYGKLWNAGLGKSRRLQVQRRNGKKIQILSRWLMDAPEGTIVDHFNRDTLDNRRIENLRFASQSFNVMNSSYSRGSSGQRGICWSHRHGKWLSRIRVNGVCIYRELSDSLEGAAEARKAFMIAYGIMNANENSNGVVRCDRGMVSSTPCS